MYKIEITNKKTKQVVVYDNLTDVNKGEKLFFKFQLDTTNLEDGEYALSLFEDGALLQTETLNVGNFSQNALQYTKGENIYVETLLDTKTEDRQVEINEVTVTIYPSEGQDAMTSVTVDASNVYNDGYEKGYDEGNEDGVAKGIIEQKEKLESINITKNGEYLKEDGYNKITVNVEDVNGNYDEGYEEGIRQQKDKLESVTITENGEYSKEDGYNKVIVNVEDVNGSYDEGYEEGIRQQKEKLESIIITENGEYLKEDGYNKITVNVEDTNGSYDEGYEDGYEDGIAKGGEGILEETQVLNITENGSYTTKYSIPEDMGREVTGYFDDGTPFYDYVQLNGKIFKTDIKLQSDSSVEIWWKPDFNFGGGFYGDGIFSTLESLDDFSIRIKTPSTGQEIKATIRSVDRTVKHDVEGKWYHFILKESGLVMDGETITSNFAGAWVKGKNLYINAYKNYSSVGSANGYYGMIKIISNGVEYIIIPTENGFKNITTDTLLEVYENGDYNFYGLPVSDDNLIRTVNVNITPKISVQEYGLRFGESKFSSVPEWVDLNGITNADNLFNYCTALTSVPFFDASKIKSAESMFNSCYKLTTIPQFIFSELTSTKRMFQYCSSLSTIPLFDTSKVNNAESMFENCSVITTIPQFDFSSLTNVKSMFSSASRLQSVPLLDFGNVTDISTFIGYSDNKNITDLGGFKNLKVDWNDNYGLYRCPNLTHESLINVITNLYDFRGNGDTTTTKTLKLNSNSMSLLTDDDKAIATNKGWTLTT